MINRNTIIIWAVGLVVALGIPVIWFCGMTYADGEGARMYNFSSAQDLNIPAGNDAMLEQEIRPERDGLAKITFPALTSSAASLKVVLIDVASGKILRQGDIALSAQPNRQTAIWEFLAIKDSLQLHMLFRVSSPETKTGFRVYSIPTENHIDGNTHLNGVVLENSVWVVDWFYLNSNPASMLIKNITYTKPGLFNSPGVWAAAFVFLFFLPICIFVQAIYYYRKK